MLPEKFELTIPGPEPRKLTMRFPSDEQIEARQKSRRMLQVSRGRQGTQTEIRDDFDLARRIVCDLADGEPDVSGEEASAILDELLACDIVDFETSGGRCRMKAALPWGEFAVSVATPTLGQVRRFRDTGSTNLETRAGSEFRVNVAAGRDLYQQLAPEPPVVPVHIAYAVAAKLQSELQLSNSLKVAEVKADAQGFSSGPR